MKYDFDALFWILEETDGVEQDFEHHPEGDVFKHSLQVLNWAFRESKDVDLILAAMLHDVGKIGGSNKHPQKGVELLSCHCSEKTLWLIENHIRFWYWATGEMRRYKKIIELHSHKWFLDLALLARWDKAGRNPNIKPVYNRESIELKIKGLLLI